MERRVKRQLRDWEGSNAYRRKTEAERIRHSVELEKSLIKRRQGKKKGLRYQ